MTVLRALRRLPPLETGVLLLCVVVLTWLGTMRPTPSEGGPKIDSFSTFDAATGGYRAFYAMLSDEGVRVDRFERRPAYLDASIDTLVYVEPFAFDPRQVEPTKSDIGALESWVRGGGRLLYIGNDLDAAKQGILHLPASAAIPATRRGPLVRSSALASDGVERVDSTDVRRWTPHGKDVRVLFADARGPLAVAYPFGRGRVTALIDETLFSNAQIDRVDRARFAFALAQPGRTDGTVAFDEMPHGYTIPDRWWTIFPRPFAVALLIACIVILVAFAGAAVRLGPPLVPFERRERSSVDFIDALSSLLDRGAARRKALVDAATSTSRAIARSYTMRDDATVDEIAERIERPDLRDAYRSLAALAANGDADDRNLLRGIALAQTIRKEYALHGRSRI